MEIKNLTAVSLKMLYFAFVFPHLLYRIEIYGNTYQSHMSKLVKLNNKILRILQNAPLKSLTLSLYKNYNTLPIPLLHDFHILLFVHKFLYHGNKMPYIFASYFTQNTSVHHYNTREKYSLHLVNSYTDFGKRLVKFKGSRLWNNLSDSVKILNSIPAFKNSLKIIY